ncbi:hypothetical protein PV327_006840 [Microctonus hyperodae]|uniref:Uncharacterized protein n=1 Tax=Microctonus hyperodae TaxID=165561 RepID=A0AA39F547_MICHY|nr:hypothetical protein PV327_006840 [Microctonus hyperodae]
MIKSTIIFLTWLAIVSSEDPIKASDNIESSSSDITTKVKRYYNHDVSPHKSPCPPFYPHLHEPKSPMHLTRPYGPPAYPKPIYGPPLTPIHHPQFIHQPIYPSYQPKQSISYVKPHIPIMKPDYHYLPSKSHEIIPHVQPIHQVIQQQAQWQYHQPQNHYQKPHFAYAPIYHKPMIYHQAQMSYIKPTNYHAHSTPGIVYKMDPIKCAPCHQDKIEHQSQIKHYYPMQQIIHVKPIHHPEPFHHSSPIYLPSHAHVQSSAVKSIGHLTPCTK